MGKSERRFWINLGWFHISIGRSGLHLTRTEIFHVGAGSDGGEGDR